MATKPNADATVDKTEVVESSTDVTGTAASGTSAADAQAKAGAISDAPIHNTDFTVVGVDVTKPPMLNPNTGLAETTLIAETAEEVAAVNATAPAAPEPAAAEPAATE